MTPDSLHELFAASAGVAGALIGLLFVALTIERERVTGDTADPVHQARASAALTAFTNALSVSLFGLVPQMSLGWTALFVALIGLLFVIASFIALRRARLRAVRDAFFIVGLGAVFVLQLYFAVRLISRSSDVGAARGVAILVVVCFLVGIARSWELIGGPQFGLAHEVRGLVHDLQDDEGDGQA